MFSNRHLTITRHIYFKESSNFKKILISDLTSSLDFVPCISKVKTSFKMNNLKHPMTIT